MVEAYKKFWKYGFTANCRTSVSDFWWAYLANILISFVLGFGSGFFADSFLGGVFDLVGGLYSLAMLVPMIMLQIRRLHDINKSGWNLFISLIPFGSIVVLVFFCLSSVEPNKYGQQI